MKRLATTLGTFLLVVPTLAFATVISVTPSSTSVSPDSTVNVALSVSGLGDSSAPSLGTYDITLAFDPSMLGFISASYGDPSLGDQLDLSGFGTFSSTSLTSGAVELFELSFDSPSTLDTQQAGAFTLADLTFNALAPGVSSLDLTANAVGDSYGNALTVQLADSQLTVSGAGPGTIPAPGTEFLLGAGLLALRFRRRSRPMV